MRKALVLAIIVCLFNVNGLWAEGDDDRGQYYMGEDYYGQQGQIGDRVREIGKRLRKIGPGELSKFTTKKRTAIRRSSVVVPDTISNLKEICTGLYGDWDDTNKKCQFNGQRLCEALGGDWDVLSNRCSTVPTISKNTICTEVLRGTYKDNKCYVGE